MVRAFITGCTGLEFSSIERAFMASADPWGLILFARNCASHQQIKALIDEFRTLTGRTNAAVLIDQEGGRVQRLGPPGWPAYPSGAAYAKAYRADDERARDLAYLAGRCIGDDLIELGINIDCAPVLDVPQRGAHDVIGDRAFGNQPGQIADIGRAMANGLLDAGVCPVIKHIPGHGRAMSDSHKALPVVAASAGDLCEIDFAPFKALNGFQAAMTAHVIYQAFDPDQPATLSKIVIEQVIRRDIGFDGLLMSDDLTMRALSGSMAQRTMRAHDAGCDLVLHCTGDMAEMEEVAANSPVLKDKALMRADKALAAVAKPRRHLDKTSREKLVNWAQEQMKTG